MKICFFTLTFLGICKVIDSKLLVEYFNISSDGSKITWAHAVNSKSRLRDALESDVMMLETDVSMGRVTNKNGSELTIEPIMAHPPLNSSDISLNEWLNTVINFTNFNGRGIKLDFKFDDTLEPSFKIMQSKKNLNEIDIPLIINADIFGGPVDPIAKPVNSTLFLKLCQQYFPSSIISPGWTTSIPANESMRHLNAYNWLHVYEMVKALRKQNITQQVTFPIRAPFIVNSFETLTWLRDVVPNSSFTVWKGAFDTVNIEELIDFRQMIPVQSVYFDLPDQSDLEILQNSDAAITHSSTPSSQCKNVLQLPYFWSNNCAIAGSTAMVLPESCIVTFNFSLSDIAKQDGFLLKGVIELFPILESNNSPDSSLILSFGQKAAKLFLFSNGVVRLFSERFGWHIVKEKGNTFGFEISIPNAQDYNNLETVVRIYPLNEKDYTAGHNKSGFHNYILDRTKGANVLFQFITNGNNVALTHLETLCVQTTNAALNNMFNIQVFWIVIIGAIYCKMFNFYL